ncbi:glycosyltransferase [Jiangella rhizosphaerae]|uniref:glycosyltransferase n=1 Tax=Jiangella rhizosphaerae TaxID=2293569 RepID=UPI001313F010|nr:glycosyltransferase [Jiangella rhizosphaerae]
MRSGLIRRRVALGAGIRAYRRRAGRPLGPWPPRRALSEPVEEFLTWNVLDRDFYAAQAGKEFADDTVAARHYLRWGLQRGFSPHPLYEPEFHDPKYRARKGADPLLRARRATKGALGPVFDLATYLDQHPEAAEHPGGALGHFLSWAGPETALPVRPDHVGAVPTLGVVRARAIAAARQWRDQHTTGHGTRLTDDFDAAAERAWIARVSRLPLPIAGDAPLVSVVIAVRNRPAQIRAAVASVLAQSLRDLELIVVDDGSDDETPDVLRELAGRDYRVRVLAGPWRGVCAARNTGIAAARGRYVAFLDSDDVYRPRFLELAVKAMAGDGLRAAHAVLDHGPGASPRYLAFDGSHQHLLVKNHVNMISLVVERELLTAIGGFDESLRRWVDHDLVIRIARETPLRLLPFVGGAAGGTATSKDRITLTEAPGWEYVVLAKHHVDWSGVADELAARVPGRVSVLIPTFQDWRMTTDAVTSVLAAAAEDDDVEVVVVDNGSRRAVSAILVARLAGDTRVRVVRAVRNLNFALGSNLAFAHSTGSAVVFLNNDTVVRPGWLRPLVGALADDVVAGAQPLLVYPDGTIQSAGTVFPGGDGFPHAFLAHHPVEDAQALGTMTGFTAVTAAALAMRAADVVALRGFDPMFINGCEDIDLCLRAVDRLGGRFAVVTASVVEHHESKTPGRSAFGGANRVEFAARWTGRLPASEFWRYERAGFAVAHLQPGTVDPAGLRTPLPVLTRPAPSRVAAAVVEERPPALRWAVKIGAHAGPRGDTWGDVHFARDLARALRRLGQQVVVDRRLAFDRATGHLDDVTLTLRGLEPYAPGPGRTNLLWVISHPDAVTAEEASRYDAVFAASAPWAASVSGRWGLQVRPLLQATDPSRFQPGASSDGGAGPVLFLGSGRRGEVRPIVRDAILAGIDLHVYGLNWRDEIPARYLRGEYLDNDAAGAAYEQARVVLNDHWADMRAHGFISNRVFDAVAAGGRVISDPIEGLTELFGPAVRTYSSPEELAALCALEPDEFCPQEALKLVSEEVRTVHSFDARARVLLDAALAARARTAV